MPTQTPTRLPEPTVLEQRRRAAGLSRERLGQRAGAISAATIKRIEDRRSNPHPSTRVALARALGCGEDDLFPLRDEDAAKTPGFANFGRDPR